MCDTDDTLDDTAEYIIVNLDGHTLYNVSVAANTIIGTGLFTVVETATTESGMFKICISFL